MTPAARTFKGSFLFCPRGQFPRARRGQSHAPFPIISYLVKDAKSPQDRIAGGLDLFLHVLYGYNDLKPKLQDILLKAQSIGEPIFSQTDYAKGCNYLLNQFLFMGATLVKPFASQALNGDNYRRYEEIIKNPSLNSMEIRSIFLKAQFVSRIIESILNDM